IPEKVNPRPPTRELAWRLWRIVGDVPRQLLRVTAVRLALCGVRWFWYAGILRRLRAIPGSDGVADDTVRYNMAQIFDLSVNRSLRLILPLVALEPVRTAISDLTILTIGPRTEGEIYNLISYGFRK